jgi:hypothetical protein
MDTDGGWHAEISFQCENKDVNVETVGYYKNMAEVVVALMKLVVGKHGGGNDEENSGQAGILWAATDRRLLLRLRLCLSRSEIVVLGSGIIVADSLVLLVD